jgi:hypothetical protein
MSNFSLGLSLFGAMIALMVLRVPISVTMFLPGGLPATRRCSITSRAQPTRASPTTICP